MIHFPKRCVAVSVMVVLYDQTDEVDTFPSEVCFSCIAEGLLQTRLACSVFFFLQKIINLDSKETHLNKSKSNFMKK